jgi:hypothetical protein
MVREIAARRLADFAQGQCTEPDPVADRQGLDAALDVVELLPKPARTYHRDDGSNK